MHIHVASLSSTSGRQPQPATIPTDFSLDPELSLYKWWRSQETTSLLHQRASLPVIITR